jgi:hypothetical protein
LWDQLDLPGRTAKHRHFLSGVLIRRSYNIPLLEPRYHSGLASEIGGKRMSAAAVPEPSNAAEVAQDTRIRR